jgi:hypothetical protein
MNGEINFEIITAKLSRSVCNDSQSPILAFVEADYGRIQKYRSPEHKLYPGTIFGIPYHESLICLSIYVSITEGALTTDVGSSKITLGEGQLELMKAGSIEISSDIMGTAGRKRVGVMKCRFSRRAVFSDETDQESTTAASAQKAAKAAEELGVLDPLPNFRFSKRRKPINWERLKLLNLNR